MQHFKLSRNTLTLLTTVLAGQTLRAQTPLYTFNGSSGDQFGRSVAPAGDVNNDGYDDVIVGAPLDDPNGASSGRVVVYSGKTGSALHVINGSAAGDELGTSVDGIGDIDHDGFDDFAAGAPANDMTGNNAGMVRAYSGKTGVVLWQWLGLENDAFFGHAIAGCGDANNDGTPDVIIGAPYEDGPAINTGAVRVFSGATGGLLRTVYSSKTDSLYGWSVDGVGDVNGDGFDDFIGGAPGQTNAWLIKTGLAAVTSMGDGTPIKLIYGTNDGDKMGWSVAGLGDCDNDSVPDFAAGAPFSDYHHVDAGEVVVISGQSGSVMHQKSNATGSQFGSSVAGVGDVDGDGHNDFLVGSPKYDFLSWDDAGVAHVFSGATGNSIHPFLGAAEGDQLGVAVASAGDVNNDGTPDVVVAAPYSDTPGTNAGYARVWLMNAPYPTGYCTAKTNSLGCVPQLSVTGVPSLHTANTFHVGVSNVLNQKPGMLFWGLNTASSSFYGGTLCVGAPFVRTNAQYSGGSASGSDCSGSYNYFFSQSYMNAMGLVPGTVVKAQYWSRDPGFGMPNNVGLSSGVSFEIFN